MKTHRMCKSNRKNWYNCMKVRNSTSISCIASQRGTGNLEWLVPMHNKMQHGFCEMWNKGFWRLEGKGSHVLQLQTFLPFHRIVVERFARPWDPESYAVWSFVPGSPNSNRSQVRVQTKNGSAQVIRPQGGDPPSCYLVVGEQSTPENLTLWRNQSEIAGLTIGIDPCPFRVAMWNV